MSTTYPHLTNGDVANLLADHRLLQVNPRPQRYANDPCPAGDGLIALAKERLIAVGDKPAVGVTEDQPVTQRMTPEAALNNVTSIDTLEELADHYTALLVEAAPLATGTEYTAAVSDMKGRVVSALATSLEPIEVPAPGQSDEELVAMYNSINSVEMLEAELSANRGEDVLLALVAMTDRLRASIAASKEPAEQVSPEMEPPATGEGSVEQQ